ncbi:hypothetical protein BLA29_001162 [Euroglyphus maynei]|uniref:BRCT domain-containing protein n=1 Tax=Euroglyphus maynei TaxID=6958 RepID=A0A1Y3B5Q1_EURMA|nr:hypothetical protein BLA29_001162 [Euroglyphus maynei]
MLNHHNHQTNFINESISTSLTHISETTSDANTNYAITPPLPLQSTNLNHIHHQQQQQQSHQHGHHHLLKNSTPHNYHGSMVGWNHHSHHRHHNQQQQQQQQHPGTPVSPLSSSNLNAQPQSRIKSTSSNQAYSLQQQQLNNDCYPFIEPHNSNSHLTTSIHNNTNNNNNNNDSSYMVKTAIMNRKILNNNNHNNNNISQRQTQPLNSNDDPIIIPGPKMDNDKLTITDNETKNRLFERRHLIIFKILEQLVDPITKTVVKESVQKNEEVIIDIGLTSFDDWNNNHNNNHNDNNNISNNANSTMLSNRSHAGSSGLLADVSSLTVNTKSSCSNSLVDYYDATSGGGGNNNSKSNDSSIVMIDKDLKPLTKKSDQTSKRSKDSSKKSSGKIDQLVDESKDKEAASALLSLQKTPIKTPKSPTTFNSPVTTIADDSSKTTKTEKSKDIVIKRLKPGMKIMAKWKDKNFYPAETVKQNETHRWMVRFEDNATRNLFENEIIRIEHLGEPNQELMVKISDELCKASVVKKMIKLDDKNYHFELEHSDEDDRTKVIKQYPLKDVFLYCEQGTILLNRFSKPAMMAAVFADVDLDNIVSGKRSRSNKQEEKKKPATNESISTSDSLSDNMATTNPTKKRKTVNNSNKDEHRSIVSSNNSTTSNRTLKNHSLANSLKTNRLTSTVGHYHERALSLSPPPHQWIIECCRQNKILDRESYILPAGYSIITNALSSDKSTFKRSSILFKGAKFYFGSQTPDKLQQLWSPVFTIHSFQVFQAFFSQTQITGGQIDIIIGDASCPTNLVHKAKQLKIPIVASEYIVQCLINGRKLSYDASPSFYYLHK